MPDKFAATWVSHTSLADFQKCQRCYYLKNVYKDPQTGHKIQIMSPPLALGQVVHEVIESLSGTPTDKRFSESLLIPFNQMWSKLSGKRGGFRDPSTEERYKNEGEEMLRRVMNHPGPVANLAVKLKEDLPHYWLSETDEIILCGKIDWLEYFPNTDSVHIIDFKTSKSEEESSSLQLPIYYLLASNTQKRAVTKASYWYLRLNDDLTPKELPNLEDAHTEVLELAKKVRLARKLGVFKCKDGNCKYCEPFEKVIRGEAEYVGVSTYNQDVYILGRNEDTEESVIL